MNRKAPKVGDLVSWNDDLALVIGTRGLVVNLCFLNEDHPFNGRTLGSWFSRGAVKIISRAR